MRRGNRTRPRLLSVAVGAVAGVLLAGGVAYATIPRANGLISGCYENRSGILRVIDAEAGKTCAQDETPISWNQRGKRGPEGEKGERGARGRRGPAGRTGGTLPTEPDPEGPEGPPGPQGEPGPQGPIGPIGPIGPQGVPGPKGDPGPKGLTGSTGPTGPTGPRGQTGPQGTSGTSKAYEFRGVEGLLQPPLGVREAIAGTLVPGRYVLFAKVTMTSVVGGPIVSANRCELKGDTDKADDVVLDQSFTTHVGIALGPTPVSATTMLSAIHEVTSSGEVKVVCFNMTGGTIGSRVLTAIKVDEISR